MLKTRDDVMQTPPYHHHCAVRSKSMGTKIPSRDTPTAPMPSIKCCHFRLRWVFLYDRKKSLMVLLVHVDGNCTQGGSLDVPEC